MVTLSAVPPLEIPLVMRSSHKQMVMCLTILISNGAHKADLAFIQSSIRQSQTIVNNPKPALEAGLSYILLCMSLLYMSDLHNLLYESRS